MIKFLQRSRYLYVVIISSYLFLLLTKQQLLDDVVVVSFVVAEASSSSSTTSSRNYACSKYKAPDSKTDPHLIQKWNDADELLWKYVNEQVPAVLDHTGSSAFDEHLKGVQAVLVCILLLSLLLLCHIFMILMDLFVFGN